MQHDQIILRPAPLSFWRVYLYMFAAIQGLLALLFLCILHHSTHHDLGVGGFYEELFWKSAASVLGLLPIAALVVYKRLRERRRKWLVDESGVKMYFDGMLTGSIPWPALRFINYRGSRLVLGSNRPDERWHRWSLNGITKEDASAFQERLKANLSAAS